MSPLRAGRSRRAHDPNSIFPPPFGGGVSSDISVPSPDRGMCTAVIGSMTQAMRAQDVLAAAAIRAQVTKISSSSTHNGCAYGVEVPCRQLKNVQNVLGNAGINVRKFI